MRILFLSNVYPSPVHPSKGRFNETMVSALQELHHVHVVCPISWLEQLRWSMKRLLLRAEQPAALNQVASTEWPLSFYTPGILRSHYGRFLWWSLKSSLGDLVQSLRPDVILSYWLHPDGDVAVRLGQEFSLPVVTMVGGSDLLVLTSDQRRAREIKQVLERADRVVAVSRDIGRKVCGFGIDSSRVAVVYRGIDPRIFSPGDRQEARQVLGLPGRGLILINVGRLVPVKGHGVLLKACSRLAEAGLDFRCYLIGDGPLRERIQIEIADRQLDQQVRIVGNRTARELAHWYRAADMTVLSSHSEGVPNVLLESMACGTPVVATDVGGVAEIIDPGLDELVEPGNDQDLARAIRDRWRNPAVSIGRRFVPSSIGESAVQLTSVLEDACAQHAETTKVIGRTPIPPRPTSTQR